MELTSLPTSRLTTCMRSQGDADGLPLLFLHDSFATSRWWVPLFALLPQELRICAPDLRGAGCAAAQSDGFEVDDFARDLAAIVSALDLHGFDLIAHGSSAAAAIEYVLTNPEAARSLTLINPVPVEGVFTPLEAIMLLEQMREDRALLEQALRGLLPVTAANDGPLFATLVDDAAAMAPAAFGGVAEGLNRWNRFGDARRLTLPCLLIWGDADPIVGRDAMTRTLVAIPGANNLEVLRGVGHAPMLEAPLLLAEKIVNFVTEDFGESATIRRRALEP
jgi:pimeloyl-ACP methyl ester carboxylesterase